MFYFVNIKLPGFLFNISDNYDFDNDYDYEHQKEEFIKKSVYFFNGHRGITIRTLIVESIFPNFTNIGFLQCFDEIILEKLMITKT